MKITQIDRVAKLIRSWILTSTTRAGSGHPTSSLSSVEIVTTLFFGGTFRFDPKRPKYEGNDRFILSKGHAAPLLYAAYAAVGVIQPNELNTLRRFTSRLEGHPTMRFPHTEAATGSLGQGLSVGVGMALAAKHQKLPYRIFVLMGDSECAEGQVWEAARLAARYKLNALVAIVDVNRLGQRGETMYGWDLRPYKRQFTACGWDVIEVDGHDAVALQKAYGQAMRSSQRPTVIIAKTVKGKGISFLENKDGWHGKALNEEELQKALAELGSVPKEVGAMFAQPPKAISRLPRIRNAAPVPYKTDELVSTRKAYGDTLNAIVPKFPNMVSLDAEVSNSTYAELFKRKNPERFYEMFIAEQNMAGVAVGMARRGLIPFASSFAAFLTRSFDQIRMAAYSGAHVVFSGSHAGVSIGQDGPSQMGLEDIAMFRSVHGSTVLYPSDAVSARKIVEQAARAKGIVYIRTTRADVPILYPASQPFPIGGSKVLRQGRKDVVTIVAAGITVHEALKAYEVLKKMKITARLIDCYSVKPIDAQTLHRAAQQTRHIVTVEDHVPEGGLGEAVAAALAHVPTKITLLAVRKMPRSGTPEELMYYEEIDTEAIVTTVQKLVSRG